MNADPRHDRVHTIPPSISVTTAAKINLALNVGPKRDDGFHELSTIYQSIGLYDRLIATWRGDGQIVLTISGLGAEDLACDQTNLAVKAAVALRDRLIADGYRYPNGLAGIAADNLGITMHIDKAIPVAGGMAGGSADAAAALCACALLWGCERMDLPQKVAEELGSDIPFQMRGGTCLGSGRGERLAMLTSLATHRWVIATATGGLATPQVYRTFDQMASEGALVPDSQIPTELIHAIETGRDISGLLTNSLQAPAIRLFPKLAEHLEIGLRCGARAALVSGSGPTCLFLCHSDAQASAIAAGLRTLPTVDQVLTASSPAPSPVIEWVSDEVDEVIDAWRTERTDIDVDSMHIWSRITRLAYLLEHKRRHAYRSQGLEAWEFDVLACLRRAGKPYRLTPSQLHKQTFVTSGTMTNRIKSLLKRGLITRVENPADGRGFFVQLSEEGKDRVDAALVGLVDQERILQSGLTAAEQAQLSVLLRQLLWKNSREDLSS